MATNKIKLVVKPTRSIPMVVKPVPKIGLMSMTPTKGDPGVGIESLEQTTKSTESGGTNVWTATLTDGTVHDFEVMNGDAGEGIAAGGEPGQALIKASNADYATRWMDILPEDTASGSVASFPDGADDLPMGVVVDIDPVQDLHGYDNPWPAGGGKNKINYLACIGLGERNGTDSVSISVSVSSDTITVTDYGSYKAGGKILKGIGHPSITGAFTVSADVKCTASQIAFGVGAYEGGGTSDVNATYAVTPNTWTHISRTFTDKTYAEIGIFLQPKENADVLEIKNLQIESGSTATAYAPYSNVCPIYGWTGAKVTRTGKNLYSRENGEYNVPVFSVDGTSASYRDVNAVWIKVSPNTTYIVSNGGPLSQIYYVRWINCDKNKNFISRPGGTLNSSNLPVTITTPSNCEWVQVAINQYDWNHLSQNDWIVQVEKGSTATAYEPYQAVTHEIPFSTSVYGGTLNVETGELVVDRKTAVADGDAIKIVGTYTDGTAYTNNIADMYNDSAYAHVGEKRILCDKLKSSTFSDRASTPFSVSHNGGNRASFNIPTCTTVAEYNAWLSENRPQIVYYLATTITLTLSPVEIRSLLGDNNVWSDTGDVSVTYKADIQKYIDKKISAAVAAMS